MSKPYTLRRLPAPHFTATSFFFKTRHTVLPNNELSVQHPKCLDPFSSDHF